MLTAPLSTWIVRVVLFLIALAGPFAAYWLVLAQTDDGTLAVNGLGWGFLVSLAATVAFGFTIKGRWPGRAAWSFVFLTLAAALWLGLVMLG